jgi:hypothetical protein
MCTVHFPSFELVSQYLSFRVRWVRLLVLSIFWFRFALGLARQRFSVSDFCFRSRHQISYARWSLFLLEISGHRLAFTRPKFWFCRYLLLRSGRPPHPSSPCVFQRHRCSRRAQASISCTDFWWSFLILRLFLLPEFSWFVCRFWVWSCFVVTAGSESLLKFTTCDFFLRESAPSRWRVCALRCCLGSCGISCLSHSWFVLVGTCLILLSQLGLRVKARSFLSDLAQDLNHSLCGIILPARSHVLESVFSLRGSSNMFSQFWSCRLWRESAVKKSASGGNCRKSFSLFFVASQLPVSCTFGSWFVAAAVPVSVFLLLNRGCSSIPDSSFRSVCCSDCLVFLLPNRGCSSAPD